VFHRGGDNSWQNLVTACSSCNNTKGSKSLKELGWQLPEGIIKVRK
jgi:5-methylcytosine-specific restriction endonuclease McrA